MSIGVESKKNDGVNFVAPDGGWGWIVVISSLLIHVIMDGITYASGQYLRVFMDDFDATNGAASVIHGLLPAVTLACGPIGSSLTNRFGCRITTIFGATIATIGFVLSVFAERLFVLYITIGFVVGIGFGLVYVPAIVSVGYYFEKRRSLAIGIAVCGAGIGTFAFAPLNRLLMNKYDWNGAFLITAGIVFNICVCATVMIPVAIEPSEILKRKKKLEKNLSVRKETISKPVELIEKNLEQDQQESNEKSIFLQVPNSSAKKLGDSMPTGLDKQKKFDETKKSSNSVNALDNDTQFFKSLPHLIEDEMAKSNENALLKSYSSLNFRASMLSLKNINEVGINEPQKIILASENKEQTEENKLFDLKILMNVLFLFFAISNFLTSLGFNAPYIYITDQAISHGISQANADILLQAIGISNMVGRIVLGFLSDLKQFNRLYLYSSVITLCGIATIIEPFLKTFPLLIVYSLTFGFTSGGYVSLTALLLVDLLGLENLSNAFGMLLVFQGVATAVGPPIAGAMYDHTGSYVISFLFIGTMITISGFMCFFFPCFNSYKKLQEKKKETEMMKHQQE